MHLAILIRQNNLHTNTNLKRHVTIPPHNHAPDTPYTHHFIPPYFHIPKHLAFFTSEVSYDNPFGIPCHHTFVLPHCYHRVTCHHHAATVPPNHRLATSFSLLPTVHLVTESLYRHVTKWACHSAFLPPRHNAPAILDQCNFIWSPTWNTHAPVTPYTHIPFDDTMSPCHRATTMPPPCHRATVTPATTEPLLMWHHLSRFSQEYLL